MDRSKGYRRDQFTKFERIRRTNQACPPPCHTVAYAVELEHSDIGGSGKSLQIAFATFSILHTEEYSACDETCIIGELGGNLGFFLGGSLLFGLDIILDCAKRMVSYTTKFLVTNDKS